jgi:hypothetical protein
MGARCTQIRGAEGHDELTGFETFQFADGSYRLNDG